MSLVTPTAASVLSPEMIRDPFPFYEALRDETPMVAGPRLDLWTLMRHDDVYAALADHETFSSSHPDAGAVFDGTPMIFDDEPRHGRFRRLVNKAFTPRRVAEAEPAIRAQVDGILDDIGEGAVDVIPELAVVLPIFVIADMLGVDRADRPDFKRWSQERSYVVGRKATTDDEDADLLEAVEAGAELDRYFARVAAARTNEPGDDLVSALIQAEIDGRRLEQWEVLGVCALLLTAGNVTTTNLIGNMLGILAGRPDLLALVRTDPGVAAGVVEETLRLQSPVQWFFRRTVRDVEVGHATIPAGSRVAVFFGAANRDPTVFAEPDLFRLDRELHKHLAFGHGIHHCLGAPLARMEARVALQALAERYDTIRPGSAPAIRQDREATHLGYSSLPLVLQR